MKDKLLYWILLYLITVPYITRRFDDLVEGFFVGNLDFIIILSMYYFIKWLIRKTKNVFNKIDNKSCSSNNLRNRQDSIYEPIQELKKNIFENEGKEMNSSSINVCEIRFCKYCGKRIDSDSIFCPYCGKRIIIGKTSNLSGNSENNSRATIDTYEPEINNDNYGCNNTHSSNECVNDNKRLAEDSQPFINDVSDNNNTTQREIQKLSSAEVSFMDLKFNVEAIDLGLSVKWGICNVGSSIENPTGDLYGWGDPTGEKKSQVVSDYIRVQNGMYGLFCATSQNISGTIDDIASAKWGKHWFIPSRKEWEELIRNCSWEKTKVQGVEGYKVTGSTGNSIFLPFTGLRYGNDISCRDAGYYWTSEMLPKDNEKAYYMYFDKDTISEFVNSRNYIYSGRAIRPVCNS